MRLNHINLTVTDVQAAAEFLENCPGMERMGGNAGMAFLTDASGFVLTLMKAGRNSATSYPGNFPIAFSVESEASVDSLNAQLREDAFAVEPPARHHGRDRRVREQRNRATA